MEFQEFLHNARLIRYNKYLDLFAVICGDYLHAFKPSGHCVTVVGLHSAEINAEEAQANTILENWMLEPPIDQTTGEPMPLAISSVEELIDEFQYKNPGHPWFDPETLEYHGDSVDNFLFRGIVKRNNRFHYRLFRKNTCTHFLEHLVTHTKVILFDLETLLPEEVTSCAEVTAIIKARMSEGETLQDATIHIKVYEPQLFSDVLEHIGSWPSSELELRALQKLAG